MAAVVHKNMKSLRIKLKLFKRQFSLFSASLLLVLIPIAAYQLAHSLGILAADATTGVTTGEWAFDDAQGTSAYDNSGYSNTLTVTGPTWNVLPNTGSTKTTFLHFDGSNDYATRAADDDFNFGTNSFTITGWIRHSANMSGTDIIFADFGAAGSKIYINSSGYLCFTIDADSTWTPADSVCGTTSLADSRWHHFSAIKTGTSTIELYVDGVRVGIDSSIVSGTLSNATALYLGIDTDGTSNPFDGDMDSITIYTYARTAAQIKTDYTGGAAVYGQSSDESLTNGLVAYYKMDDSAWTNDCSTSTVTDSSGNGFTALSCPASTGPVGAAAGKFHLAGDFDGTDDYIAVADNSILDPPTGLTVATWVYFDSLPGAADAKLIYKDHSVSPWMSYELSYDETTQKLIFQIVDSNSNYHVAYSSEKPATGTWLHVVGVRTASDMRVIVNGIAGPTYPVSGTMYNSDGYLLIGKAGGNPTNGKLDEVRIYNRALSPAEVSQLYNWAPGPVLYYSLDDNTGTGASAVKDKSGNNLHGTMEATMTAADWQPGKIGSALRFDGSNDDVSLTDGSGSVLDFTGDFTISAWVNRTGDTGASQLLVSKLSGVAAGGYDLALGNAGEVYCQTSNGVSLTSTYTATSIVTTSTGWKHIVIRRIGTSCRVFIDGVDLTSTTGTHTTMTANNDSFLLGDWGGSSQPFSGLLDEVKVYNYARTQGQIIDDMNAGHPAGGSPVGSQIGYWKFDEGYGDTANDSSPQNLDADLAGSGGTCPGAANCPSWTSDGKFNKALDFDGTNDYIDLTTPLNINTTGDSRGTISFWFRPDWASSSTATSHGFTGSYNSTSTDVFSFGFCGSDANCAGSGLGTAGDLSFTALNNIPTVQSKVTIAAADYSWAADEWVHVTLVWDDTLSTDDLRIYINGIEPRHSTTNNGSLDVSALTLASKWYIGDQAAVSVPFDGTIDEYQLYNSALTPDQIKLLYNQSKAVMWGATSTSSTGTSDNSAAREYCIPGDSTTCTPPVAEWKMDENTSTSVKDTAGSNHSLGATGPVWIPGDQGSALLFDGVDDYANTDDNAIFNAGSAYTISAWLKPASYGEGNVGNFLSKGGVVDFYVRSASTSFAVYYYGSGEIALSGAGSVTMDQWQHVNILHDGSGNFRFFINGLESNADTAAADTDSSAGIVVGSSSTAGADAYDGGIDTIRIFDYQRTPAQIAWDYDHGKPWIWYKMDENTGVAVNNTTGKGNNGTLTSATWVDGKHDYALNFSGTTQYVSLTDNMLDSQQVGSVCTWINPTTAVTDGTTQCILGFGDTAGTTYKSCVSTNAYANPTIAYFIRVNGTSNSMSIVSDQILTKNSWQHVCIVQDGTKGQLYVNGAPVTATYTTAGTGTTGDWFGDIGANAENVDIARLQDNTPADYFEGKLDDFMIFTYPLTSQQVKDVYNQGAVQFR